MIRVTLFAFTIRETAGWVILAAAVITATGVIWRKVIHPLGDILAELHDYRAYLHRQLSDQNGEGTVRAQLNRIEEAVTHEETS